MKKREEKRGAQLSLKSVAITAFLIAMIVVGEAKEENSENQHFTEQKEYNNKIQTAMYERPATDYGSSTLSMKLNELDLGFYYVGTAVLVLFGTIIKK